MLYSCLYTEFVKLHRLSAGLAILPASVFVRGERSIHDDGVEVVQREPDLFAFIDLGGVEGFERS